MPVYATTDDLEMFGLPASWFANVPLETRNAHLASASKLADGYLFSRYKLPLVSWGTDLTQQVCELACASLARRFGQNAPDADTMQLRRIAAMRWLEGVNGASISPTDIIDSTVTTDESGIAVVSDPSRGWGAVETE